IDFSAPVQVARGSVVTDTDGPRRATLFFKQGTTAEMVLPDGSTSPLTQLHVRATEYTVGPNGPKAMPAPPPPPSRYPYAAAGRPRCHRHRCRGAYSARHAVRSSPDAVALCPRSFLASRREQSEGVPQRAAAERAHARLRRRERGQGRQELDRRSVAVPRIHH